MKKFFLLLALIAAVSCVKDGLDDYNPVSGTYSLTLTATAPESSVDTKTQISDDLSVSWSEEDKIKVCFPVNFEMSNTTGRTLYGVSGDFVLSQQNGSKAVFSTDEWNVDLNALMNGAEGRYVYNSVGYAFYPTTVAFSSRADSYASGSYTCSHTIPSEQNAVEGSFDQDLNPAYAVIDRAELAAGNANVVFKNLAALVRINLGEEIDNVKEIQINTANSGPTTVCGEMTLTIGANDNPGVTASPTKLSSATPVCLRREDGEMLQAGETYYAVIAPGRTHVGLKLTFIGENGEKLEKTVKIDGYWAVQPSECWTINVKNPIVYPEPAVLEVDETSFETSYTGGEKTFNVTSNYGWSAAVTSSNTTWLHVSPASGSENGSFTVTVDENTDLTNTRSAEITVTSQEKKVVITVTQDCRRYYITEQVASASGVVGEGLYVFQFAEDTDYYWQVDVSGNSLKTQVNSLDKGFTADFVFQYIGGLISLRNDMYLNMFGGRFDCYSDSENFTYVYFVDEDGGGIRMEDYYYYRFYYNSQNGGFDFSDTYSTPWNIYKVELR